MTGPREHIAGMIVPVDIVSGKVITPMQETRTLAIVTAQERLFEAMHQAEGSTMPGDHQEHVWSTRRMSIAATHIETAALFAIRQVLEVS